jgi:CheY-like chemotaxis protein
MDGWQIARAFRKHCLLSKVRIVAVSAYQTEADKLQSEAAGIDLHLGKPVHQIEILLAIMGESPTTEPCHHR